MQPADLISEPLRGAGGEGRGDSRPEELRLQVAHPIVPRVLLSSDGPALSAKPHLNRVPACGCPPRDVLLVACLAPPPPAPLPFRRRFATVVTAAARRRHPAAARLAALYRRVAASRLATVVVAAVIASPTGRADCVQSVAPDRVDKPPSLRTSLPVLRRMHAAGDRACEV